MKFNSSSQLSFDEAVKAADKILREKNPKFRRITKLFISRELRPYSYFCYYYLRWVDDFVDNNANSIEQKKIFFKTQFNLISSITSGKDVELNFVEEYFLYYYINFLISKKKIYLVDEIIKMMRTIRQDISRLENDGIYSEAELDEYLDCHAQSLFRTVNAFLIPDKELEYSDKYSSIKTLIDVLLIKDLNDDISLGYINISREEIAMFQLDTKDLINDRRLKDWHIYKIDQLKAKMVGEVGIIKKFPLTMKLFWFLLFPYCLHKLNRINLYNYNPVEIRNKNIIKEGLLYSFTVINVFKYVFRIFL